MSSEPEPISDPDPSRLARPIHRFVVYAGLGLLLLGWLPGASELYARSFQAQSDAVFSSLGAGRSVEFSWVAPDSRRDRSDTMMKGRVAGEPEHRWRAMYSLRRRGYWPLAAWLAVMVATPMAIGSRLRGLAVGALALHALLMAQIAFIALCAFGASQPQPDAFWESGATIATALFNSPVPTYALLFVLWAWLANPSAGIAVSGVAESVRRRLGLAR